MCERSGLLQELLREALEARREEEGGGHSPRVRHGEGWGPMPLLLLPALLRRHAALPCIVVFTRAAAASCLLPFPNLQAVQARRGAVSMQGQRHVRALTASERLASTRFQVRACMCMQGSIRAARESGGQYALPWEQLSQWENGAGVMVQPASEAAQR